MKIEQLGCHLLIISTHSCLAFLPECAAVRECLRQLGDARTDAPSRPKSDDLASQAVEAIKGFVTRKLEKAGGTARLDKLEQKLSALSKDIARLRRETGHA